MKTDQGDKSVSRAGTQQGTVSPSWQKVSPLKSYHNALDLSAFCVVLTAANWRHLRVNKADTPLKAVEEHCLSLENKKSWIIYKVLWSHPETWDHKTRKHNSEDDKCPKTGEAHARLHLWQSTDVAAMKKQWSDNELSYTECGLTQQLKVGWETQHFRFLLHLVLTEKWTRSEKQRSFR